MYPFLINYGRIVRDEDGPQKNWRGGGKRHVTDDGIAADDDVDYFTAERMAISPANDRHLGARSCDFSPAGRKHFRRAAPPLAYKSKHAVGIVTKRWIHHHHHHYLWWFQSSAENKINWFFFLFLGVCVFPFHLFSLGLGFTRSIIPLTQTMVNTIIVRSAEGDGGRETLLPCVSFGVSRGKRVVPLINYQT